MARSAEDLAGDLARLGVERGGLLMVHSALSAIGPVTGGPETVIDALLGALGPDGTLVLPTFRDGPHRAGRHRTPPPGLEEEARAWPPFDPGTTPTNCGAIPAASIDWPGAVRSTHPMVSVTCIGPRAREIAEPHPLAYGEGAGTPFERLYDLDAQLLLLGVGFNRLTMLHHAESRAPNRRVKTRAMIQDGTLHLIPDMGNDLDTHFPVIGARYLRRGTARQGVVAQAPAILMRARDVTDFAVAYFRRHDPNLPPPGRTQG